MPIFIRLCFGVDEQLGNLIPMEKCAVFESCRLAAMIFVEIVLLRHNTPNEMLLSAGIKRALAQADMECLLGRQSELMIWILFMGNVAAAGTEMEPWFQRRFAHAVSFQRLTLFETVKSVVIEFLWLEGVSNELLKSLWSKVKELI